MHGLILDIKGGSRQDQPEYVNANERSSSELVLGLALSVGEGRQAQSLTSERYEALGFVTTPALETLC